MGAELSGRVFEWLLAGWAGHQEHPEEVFPVLKDVNLDQLNYELSSAIRNAEQLEGALR